MVVMIILTIIAVLARILMGVFVDSVSFFSALLTPMTIISVVLGVIAAAFVIKNLSK